MRSLKLHTASILGAVGWLLLIFPQSIVLYSLIRHGQLFRDLFALFNSGAPGMSDSRFYDVDVAAISIGPLTAAVACGCIFGECSGILRAWVRRIASFIAVLGLLISAAGVIWQFFILRNAILRGGESVLMFKIGVALTAFCFCSWAFLFGILGVAAAPFGRRITQVISGVLAIEMVAVTLIWIYTVQHWRFARLFAYAISLAPLVLLCVFAVASMQARKGSHP